MFVIGECYWGGGCDYFQDCPAHAVFRGHKTSSRFFSLSLSSVMQIRLLSLVNVNTPARPSCKVRPLSWGERKAGHMWGGWRGPGDKDDSGRGLCYSLDLAKR